MKSDKVAHSRLKSDGDFISAANDINKSSLNEEKTRELSAMTEKKALCKMKHYKRYSVRQGRNCNYQENEDLVWLLFIELHF